MEPETFDKAVTQAFHFLSEEYGYEGIPSPKINHWLQPNSKTFRKGNLSITFSAGYDIDGYFLLSFSPIDLRERAHPKVSEYYLLCDYSLKKILSIKGVEVSLPTEGGVDVAHVFAETARLHASDVILGDFSIFSPLYYTVECREVSQSYICTHTMGVFSSLEKADGYLEQIPSNLHGGKLEFQIYGRELDLGEQR